MLALLFTIAIGSVLIWIDVVGFLEFVGAKSIMLSFELLILYRCIKKLDALSIEQWLIDFYLNSRLVVMEPL